MIEEINNDLNDINDKYIKEVISSLIESQQEFTNGDQAGEFSSKFSYFSDHKKIVKEIYNPNNFVGFDLVSVQAATGPVNIARCNLVETFKEELTVKTRKLKTYPYTGSCTNLSIEEITDSTCKEITTEFNREIITDLRNNFGTGVMLSNISKLEETIDLTSKSIEEKCGQYPNWIICTPEIYTALTKKSIDSTKIGVYQTFKDNWNGYKIIVDVLMRDIVIGYKGYSHYDSPYIYMPYIPYAITPEIACEGFCPRRGFLCRYGKKLIPQGCNYYGKITITPDLNKELLNL